jgi:hypothetical protein
VVCNAGRGVFCCGQPAYWAVRSRASGTAEGTRACGGGKAAPVPGDVDAEERVIDSVALSISPLREFERWIGVRRDRLALAIGWDRAPVRNFSPVGIGENVNG